MTETNTAYVNFDEIHLDFDAIGEIVAFGKIYNSSSRVIVVDLLLRRTNVDAKGNIVSDEENVLSLGAIERNQIDEKYLGQIENVEVVFRTNFPEYRQTGQ